MAELLHTPFTVLHIMACTFLILVILIQPGKSGGLGALGGGGAQQVFGGGGAGNFLTKTTWVTAAIFFLRASRWPTCRPRRTSRCASTRRL